jgi:hypothetical protein
VRGIVAEIWAVLRVHNRLLFAAALVIFVPIGLLETLDDELQKPLEDVDELTVVQTLEVIVSSIVHIGGALGGEVLYAGIVAGAIAQVRLGQPRPSLTELLRHLPFLKLAAIDLLLALVVGLSLLLLVVPGIVALVYFCLAPAAVKIERRGIIDAFRRSFALVRGHFWMAFWLVIPVLVIGDVLTELAGSGAITAFGETFAGHWIAATAVNMVAAPLFALAAVELFYELRDSGPDPAER